MLALKLKCSGKTTRMPTQACRQPPPRRNFDKSFVKCVRTKDFVGAALVFRMKKPAVVFVLFLLQFFSANRTSVEQERFLFLVIFRSRNTERFNSYSKIKVKHVLFFLLCFRVEAMRSYCFAQAKRKANLNRLKWKLSAELFRSRLTLTQD